ncbi:hypothetical protein A9Z06_02510 [Rhizobium sp. YK2]|nr:hypothetical protein A9Z06_02510 [Rhizobium sp. YK2]
MATFLPMGFLHRQPMAKVHRQRLTTDQTQRSNFAGHPDIRQVPRKILRIASDRQRRVNLVYFPDDGLEQPDAGSCHRDTARPGHYIVDGDKP